MTTTTPSARMSALTYKFKRRAKRKHLVKSKSIERRLKTQSQVTVSEATRQRLIAEATASPAFEGMSPEAIEDFIDDRLKAFLSSYPWWYGYLPKDKPKKAPTEAQLAALDRARQARTERNNDDAEFAEYLAQRRRQEAATS